MPPKTKSYETQIDVSITPIYNPPKDKDNEEKPKPKN